MLGRTSGLAKRLVPALCLLLSTAGAAAAPEPPAARGGTMDLRGWDFARDGVVPLQGEWRFSARVLEEPGSAPEASSGGDVSLTVPGDWNQALAAHGYGTYRLTILCNDANDLALAIPGAHSAMRLYVNGRAVAIQGGPGITPAASRPAPGRRVIALGNHACPLRLAALVSNFDHRLGGLLHAPRLGTQRDVAGEAERAFAVEMLLAVSLGVMCLLCLMFHLTRRRDSTPLWLALFCASLLLHVVFSGGSVPERLALRGIGWEAYLKLEALGAYLAPALLALFLRALYPGAVNRGALRVLLACSLAAAAAVLLLPARWHTHAGPFMQAVTLAACAWLAVALAAAAWRRRSPWAASLAPMAAALPLITLDAAGGNVLLHYVLAPAGIAAFVLAPGAVLAHRFARALDMEELRAHEERHRVDLLGRASKVGLLEWDGASRATSFSGRYCEMLGYPADADTSAWDFFDMVHPDDRDIVRGFFLGQISDRSRPNAVRQHTPWEFRLRRADGGQIWVHAESTSITGAEGQTLRYVGSFIDITEQRTVEQALRNQVKFTGDVFDSVPVGLAMRDAQGKYFFVNRAWEQYSGSRRADAIGRTPHELLPKEEADAVLAADRRSLAGGLGGVDLTELSHAGRRYVQTRTVMADADGRVMGVLIASLDVTDRLAMEHALAIEQQRLALVLRATQAGIVDWDTATESPWYSERFKEMLGYPADAPPWPSLFGDLMHPEDRDRSREVFFKGLIREAEPNGVLVHEPLELRLRRADGTWLWVESMGLTLHDEHGASRRYLAAVTDISARRAQAEALVTEQRRLDLVVRAAKMGTLDWDGASRTVYYSPRFKEILGYPPDADTSGWPDFFEFVHPEDRARVKDGFREHILGTGPKGKTDRHDAVEYRLRRADGTYVWVERQSVSVRNEKGHVTRFTASYTDITERRAQQEALRRSDERYDVAMRAVNEGVYDWNVAEGTIFYSDAVYRVLGVPRSMQTPEDWAGRVHPDDRGRYRAALVEHLKGLTDRLHCEYRYRAEDGSWRWARQHGLAIRDDQGRAVRVVGSTGDVTELKLAELALARERERLMLLVRATRAGFMDWDAGTGASTYSDRFKEMLGYPPEADTSAWPEIFDMIHPEEREAMRIAFREILRSTSASGESMHGPLQYRLRRADGSYVWVEVQGVAVRDGGRVKRFTASFTDITERRLHEEALRENVRLREDVERMSRHDLKTPLNSVIAVSRLLRDGSRLAPEDEELLSIVERAGYRILSMVNLSLDLFRMEQGTYQFRPQSIDLAEVARKVARDLDSQAASKSVSVQVHESRPAIARAEELLCYSMLANLLKNAIEAAPEGSAVTVRLESDGNGVLLEIHNAGAVPQPIRQGFFEKYATAGKSGGLGLGTYSARLMARVQEGDVTMRTGEAEGTTIAVRLLAASGPVSAPVGSGVREQRREGVSRLPELPPLRVLLVDDDEFNRLVLRRYLPSPPLAVSVAVNGRAAIEAARSEWPDVVLLDLEMPVMDGYRAAARLREVERSEGRKRLTIIANSSNDDEPTIKRAMAAGCDHYLVKPAPRDVLWRLLAGARPGSPAAGAAAEALPADASHRDPVVVDPDLEGTLPAFLDSRRKALDDMPSALAAGDRDAFRRLAHRTAGGLALYGFHWAAGQCRSLERDAAAGDAAALEARVARVRAHLDAVEVRLAKRREAS